MEKAMSVILAYCRKIESFFGQFYSPTANFLAAKSNTYSIGIFITLHRSYPRDDPAID